MLTDKYNITTIRKNLIEEWKPFPPAADRNAWEEIMSTPANQQRKEGYLQEADQLLGKPWPALPATLYMTYTRTGNRSTYDTPYFQRRYNLSLLALAECLEYKGRYIDEIINGLVTLCEEGSWVPSAHSYKENNDPFPPHDSDNIDLFSSETAFTVAEVLFSLQDEVQAISPALCKRIHHELMSRVIIPFEKKDDFWWMSGKSNWSSWCAVNLLGTALCVKPH